MNKNKALFILLTLIFLYISIEILLRGMGLTPQVISYTHDWSLKVSKSVLSENDDSNSDFQIKYKMPAPINPQKQRELPKIEPIQSLVYQPGIRKLSDEFGIFHKSSIQSRSIRKSLQGKSDFDVIYSTDELGRRRTIYQEDLNRKTSVAVFGSSDVFGYGLDDNQTIPSFIATHSQARALNYGSDLWGPGNFFLYSKSKYFPSESEKAKRNLVLIFCNPTHMDRLIGHLNIYRFLPAWVHFLPSFSLKDKKLQHTGYLSEAEPRNTLLKIFAKSSLLALLGIDYPLYIEPDQLSLYAKVMSETKAEIKRKIPDAEFIAVFRPGPANKKTIKAMINALNLEGIHTLDYSQIQIEQYITEPVFVSDYHPSSASNEFIAKMLIHDLGI